MQDHSEQLDRIKQKLSLAAKKDPDFTIFGASSHEYVLRQPLSEQTVQKFENEFSTKLPDCYRSFVLTIGHGGKSYAGSGAGPFYGIYPLGVGTDELIHENPERYLKNDCILHPKITKEEWERLTERIENDEDISDDEYDEELGKIYGGILPLGSQGCEYVHGLVLNGKHKGKMVNLSTDCQRPHFCFENNFLDWYERWLDEVISGQLQEQGIPWFGYTMGGTDIQLLNIFQKAKDDQTKLDALNGLLTKQELQPLVLDSIEQSFLNIDGNFSNKLLQILSKNQHSNWRAYLKDEEQCSLQHAFQFIYHYDKENCSTWLPFVKESIHRISEHETFQFCTYILEETGIDYGELIKDFIKHEDKNIRVTTLYALGKLSNKSDYRDVFTEGLNDGSEEVVLYAINQSSGILDDTIHHRLKNLINKLSAEQVDFVSNSLERRLTEFSNHKDIEQVIENDVPTRKENAKRKWYQFWK